MINQGDSEKRISGHRKKQKAETRELILNSAGNLFEKLGFEKTTMRAVAAEAEMGYGTIFKHFSNKADLLAACMYETIEKALTEAFKTLPVDTSFQNQFLHIAGTLIRDYGARPILSKTYLENIFAVEGTWKEIVDSQIEQFLNKLEEMIEKAKGQGEIRKDVENGLLALSLFSSYLSTLSLSFRANTFDPEETIRGLGRLINLNLKGVLTEPA
jgi:AcrR family transcriptional regulator